MKLGDITGSITPEELRRRWYAVDLCSLTGAPRPNILTTRMHEDQAARMLDHYVTWISTAGFWPACHGAGGWAFRHG